MLMDISASNPKQFEKVKRFHCDNLPYLEILTAEAYTIAGHCMHLEKL